MADVWPVLAATAVGSGGTRWDLALGVGSLILLAGGVAAMVARSMDLRQALTLLALAAVMSALTLLALRLPDVGALASEVYVGVAIFMISIGGVAMAILVATSRRR